MKQKRTTACRVWMSIAIMLATALGVRAQGNITLKLLDERIHFRLSRQQPVDVILQVLSDMGIAQFVRGEEGIVVR